MKKSTSSLLKPEVQASCHPAFDQKKKNNLALVSVPLYHFLNLFTCYCLFILKNLSNVVQFFTDGKYTAVFQSFLEIGQCYALLEMICVSYRVDS